MKFIRKRDEIMFKNTIYGIRNHTLFFCKLIKKNIKNREVNENKKSKCLEK